MSFEVSGKLHRVYPTEAKSPTFQTRDFVIEVPDGQYMQYVKFQLTRDKVGIVDNFKVGDTVKVSFNLRGREWQDKFFTNLDAWRIESVQGGASAPKADDNDFGDPFKDTAFPAASDEPAYQGKDDDLPF